MQLDFKIIGQRVKESRLQNEMSQAVLAERINMSVTYISRIETAKKQASLDALVRIANVLGVTVDHFLCENQTNYATELGLARLFEQCNSSEKRIIYDVALATRNRVP